MVTKRAAVKKAAVKKAAVKKAAVKKAAVKKAAVKKAAKRAARRGPLLAKVTWKLETSNDAFGIFVNAEQAWMSNDSGDVHVCNLRGEVQRSLKVPSSSRCIIADEHWIYAGTQEGLVYDLTGDVARAVYQVAPGSDILWMDIYQGNLCVADDAGGISVYDPGEVQLWTFRDTDESSMWMVRADGAGVYAGGSKSVRAFDWGGASRWKVKHRGVLFGVQTADAVYAAGDGVTGFTKTGEKLVHCDGRGFPSCAVSPDGSRIFGGDWNEQVHCYDEKGELQWTLATGCGSALSMQFRDGVLYIVTDEGTLAALDVSPAAIAEAQAGAVTQVSGAKAPNLSAAAADTTHLESTRTVGDGVLLECVKDGSKLRVRVLSEGYKRDWFVQFPRDIRKAGAKYVVDKVLEATQGGFYRVLGNIRSLEE
jgi:hypothetical protein